MRRPPRRGQVLTFSAGLPPCLIGMEACATAHYWARELRALGHEVRLVPPQCVRHYHLVGNPGTAGERDGNGATRDWVQLGSSATAVAEVF
jgi:hypothetical protein